LLQTVTYVKHPEEAQAEGSEDGEDLKNGRKNIV